MFYGHFCAVKDETTLRYALWSNTLLLHNGDAQEEMWLYIGNKIEKHTELGNYEMNTQIVSQVFL